MVARERETIPAAAPEINPRELLFKILFSMYKAGEAAESSLAEMGVMSYSNGDRISDEEKLKSQAYGGGDPAFIQTRCDLGTAYLDGKQASEVLIMINEGLVKKVARKCQNSMVSFDELCQAGRIGLYRALQGYNPELGYQFSTYAYPCIWSEILRAMVDEWRPEGMSRNMAEMFIELLDIKREIQMQEGYPPDNATIAAVYNQRLEMDEARCANQPHGKGLSRKRHGKKHQIDEEVVKRVFYWLEMEDVDKLCLEDRLAMSRYAEMPFEVVCQEILKEQLNKTLPQLSSRQERVLRLRFFSGAETDQEVAELLNITRAGAGGIKREALKRLRHPSRIRNLKDFY